MCLFTEVVILVSFMDRPKLFCSSHDLVESLEHPTHFCKFSGKYLMDPQLLYDVLFSVGVVESYILNQGTLWWILNISAIYWKVQFPFHSRYYDKTNRTRYIHVACVVAAICFPIISPVTISLKGGFTVTRIPPIVCLGKNLDANFYTLVLPNAILYAIGTTLLLLILWRIRKVYTIIKLS